MVIDLNNSYRTMTMMIMMIITKTSCSKTRPLRVSIITKSLIFGTIVGGVALVVGVGGNWIAEALRVTSRSGQ